MNETVRYNIEEEWPLYCEVFFDGSFRVVQHRHEATHRCRRLPPYEDRMNALGLIEDYGIHHEIGPELVPDGEA